jgi:hypothetical protein
MNLYYVSTVQTMCVDRWLFVVVWLVGSSWPRRDGVTGDSYYNINNDAMIAEQSSLLEQPPGMEYEANSS